MKWENTPVTWLENLQKVLFTKNTFSSLIQKHWKEVRISFEKAQIQSFYKKLTISRFH